MKKFAVTIGVGIFLGEMVMAQSIPTLPDAKLNQSLSALAADIERLYSQRANAFALQQGRSDLPCPMSPQDITNAFSVRHPATPLNQEEIESEQDQKSSAKQNGYPYAKVVIENYSPYFVNATCVDGKLEGPFVGLVSYKTGAEGQSFRTQMIEKVEGKMRAGKPSGIIMGSYLMTAPGIPDMVGLVMRDMDQDVVLTLSRTVVKGFGGASDKVNYTTIVRKAVGGDRRKLVSTYTNSTPFTEISMKGGYRHGKSIMFGGSLLSKSDNISCYIEGEKTLDPDCKVD